MDKMNTIYTNNIYERYKDLKNSNKTDFYNLIILKFYLFNYLKQY